MRLIDDFKYALSSIKTRKLRSALTILGVVIGIAAIVAMTSLGNGFDSAITSQLNDSMSADIAQINKGAGGFREIGAESSVTFNLTDIDALNEIDGVEFAVALIMQRGWITFDQGTSDEENVSVTLIGVDFGNYTNLYDTFAAEEGAISLDSGNSSFVIGFSVGEDLDLGDSLVFSWTYEDPDTEIQTNATYTANVAGILYEIGSSSFSPGGSMGGMMGGMMMGSSSPSDMCIYLPMQKALELFDVTGATEVDMILLKLTDSSSETYAIVSDAISEYFDGKANIREPIAITNSLSSSFDTITVFLTCLGGISLIVAGIGIMNIMLVSLMERTREIGILKALGTSGGSIMTIFLTEVSIFGLIGGGLGLLVGYVIALLFGQNVYSMLLGSGGMAGGRGAFGLDMIAITPTITPDLVGIAFGFGLLVSLVFGLYPAWRASRLKPIESLRYE